MSDAATCPDQAVEANPVDPNSLRLGATRAAAASGRLGAVGIETGGQERGFLPAVEGMRACAAVGVVITHVAFQTGHTTWATGRLLGRFDLAVAVFFALSGFLLWR